MQKFLENSVQEWSKTTRWKLLWSARRKKGVEGRNSRYDYPNCAGKKLPGSGHAT
jgi:hypothetical protein